jgi:hypothetical protein
MHKIEEYKTELIQHEEQKLVIGVAAEIMSYRGGNRSYSAGKSSFS